ncbi:hypothetical protein ACJMK2_031681 [Sinanodonta woodiana]|uniref:Uncharacterized protein n=1 Tax=Sinanodonta woodiana TaxID=1069815 RepID=A0ABD3X310_SINWO
MNEHGEETNNQIEREPNTRVQKLQSEVKERLFASETKRTWNPPEKIMSGTSRESGYDVVAGVINMTSEAASKIYDGRDASMLNTKEQKVNITTSNAEYNDQCATERFAKVISSIRQRVIHLKQTKPKTKNE